MNICLVRANHHSHLIQPPLSLGYLQASLRKAGHHVTAIDALRDGLSNDEVVARCRGYGLVGVSILSAYYRESAELCKMLRDAGHTVVVGGPHVSALCHSYSDIADFVVAGEGDESLPAIAKSIQKNEWVMAGVPYLWKATNLDDLPFPDWTGMEPSTYPLAPHGGVAKSYPIAPIISSRGCPYACSFCASPKIWESKIRFRSPSNVVDEIEHLITRYGVKEVHFEDDNFTLRRDHAACVAEEILVRGLKIDWALPNGVRADKVDVHLLALLKRAGLYSVAFGIESGNDSILEKCGKRETIAQIEDAVNAAAEVGLITQGFFIFGLPGETERTIETTIRFACRLPLDKAQFLLLDVMPGTRLWDEMDDKPALSTDSYHQVTFCPPGLDPEVLRRAPGRAFRRFFMSRPTRALKMLRMIRPQQLRYVLRRMADFHVFE